jgi:hypothetical protein
MTMHASLLDATKDHAAPESAKRSNRPVLIFFGILTALALLAVTLRDTDLSRLPSILGLGEPAQAASVPQMSENERRALLSITEAALEKPELIGEDALAKNEALPFSDAPIPCGQAVCDPQLFFGALG